MSVVICDADGELWFERADELNMDCISMPYTYGGKEYLFDCGRTTDFRHFYDAVRAGEIAKTMALNPQDYVEIIEPYFAKGEDILYVSFSHAMSGTFNQLDTALRELAEKYPERKCTVFDTKSISMGAGIQMEYAGMLKQQGLTNEQILEKLPAFRDKAVEYFVVDDLMHLKRGGRLSSAAAFAGTLLALKPMLTLDEKGSLKVFEKISGKRKAMRTLAEKVVTEIDDLSFGVYVLDADSPADGELLSNMIKEKMPNLTIKRQTIGPVIGAHCGPGTVGVIFVGKKRPIPLVEE